MYMNRQLHADGNYEVFEALASYNGLFDSAEIPALLCDTPLLTTRSQRS